MNLDGRLESMRAILLGKPGAVEEFPFGPEVMVYKVAGKMFGIISWEENPLWISLKCDPERALELREAHTDIIPGYHLSKRLWNTLILKSAETQALVEELVDHSYDLIVASLPKAKRLELE